MKLEQVRSQVEALPEDHPSKKAALESLAALAELYATDPLSTFHCCPEFCGVPLCKPHPRQHAFGVAHTRITAAISGNRFGKTAIGCVKGLVNSMDQEDVPERLRPLRFVKHMPTRGRIVGPDLQSWMHGVLIPELRKWCPPRVLKHGSFDKAWNKVERVLSFANGSWIQVMTYEMDVDKFGGAALDWVWFDEPPPDEIYDECKMRIGTPNGLRMFFTLTPLNMEGSNAAFVYREIWKQREAPQVTVVRGSIHDNPHLLPEEVDAVLEGRDPDDPRRRAREYGDFGFWGGLVYPGGFEDNLCPVPSPEFIRGKDVVVGIDPGLRNAAFIWVAFDGDNHAWVFDEVLIQNGIPAQFARAIELINRKWRHQAAVRDRPPGPEPLAHQPRLGGDADDAARRLLRPRQQRGRGRLPERPGQVEGQGAVRQPGVLRAEVRSRRVPLREDHHRRLQAGQGERPPPRRPSLRADEPGLDEHAVPAEAQADAGGQTGLRSLPRRPHAPPLRGVRHRGGGVTEDWLLVNLMMAADLDAYLEANPCDCETLCTCDDGWEG